MDQYWSAIVVAALTGVVSIVSLIIQKKQGKIITTIDDKAVFIQKEYELKKAIKIKENEKSKIFEEMVIFLLKNTFMINELLNNGSPALIENKNNMDVLCKNFTNISNEIRDLQKDYSLLNSLNEQSLSISVNNRE